MVEIIEGTAVEVEPIRAMVVAQPGQSIIADSDRPAGMIAVATALADALRNIVEKQQLYTVINGKKFPQVEAWMTIGRMDNVVAREAERPIRNDDGSYEATVELVRLSDGMVIGRASAMCGAPDDDPWGGSPARNGKPAKPPRAEHARRSMAVTRATSRAFRQQYSWVMALAGYEPTPADEMPDERGQTHQPASRIEAVPLDDGGLTGTVYTKGTADYELRQSPDGPVLPFRVTQGSGGIIVVARGPLAEALATIRDTLMGKPVTVWGIIRQESFKNGQGRTITYPVMDLERVKTPDGILPAPSVAPAASDGPVEAPSVEAWDLAALDAELAR